jgi:hypothetical protein
VLHNRFFDKSSLTPYLRIYLRWTMRCAFSIFQCPFIFHLRNLKNVEKAAISCVFEVDCYLFRPRQEGKREQCGVENDWAAC